MGLTKGLLGHTPWRFLARLFLAGSKDYFHPLMSSSVSARLNANLLDENYERWLADPRSVDGTWAAFFEGFELGVVQAKPKGEAASQVQAKSAPTSGAATVGADLNGDHNLNFLGRVVSLVYNYRTWVILRPISILWRMRHR